MRSRAVVSSLLFCLLLALVAHLSSASSAVGTTEDDPIGALQLYAGSSDPPGGVWKIADGRPVSALGLTAAQENAWQGAVSGTPFSNNLPDLRGRNAIGTGGTLGASLGATGCDPGRSAAGTALLGSGQKCDQHLLSASEVGTPAHSHGSAGTQNGSLVASATTHSHSATSSGPTDSSGAATASHSHEGNYTLESAGNHNHRVGVLTATNSALGGAGNKQRLFYGNGTDNIAMKGMDWPHNHWILPSGLGYAKGYHSHKITTDSIGNHSDHSISGTLAASSDVAPSEAYSVADPYETLSFIVKVRSSSSTDSDPVGSVQAVVGDVGVNGVWVEAKGQSVASLGMNSADNAALRDSLGGSYLSADKLPDLRGRVPLGATDGATSARLSFSASLGSSGGATSQALSPAQSGSKGHTHSASSSWSIAASGAASHSLATPSFSSFDSPGLNFDGGHSHVQTTPYELQNSNGGTGAGDSATHDHDTLSVASDRTLLAGGDGWRYATWNTDNDGPNTPQTGYSRLSTNGSANHNHQISIDASGYANSAHYHNLNYPQGGAHTHPGSSGQSASASVAGEAHSVLDPYMVVRYLVKIQDTEAEEADPIGSLQASIGQAGTTWIAAQGQQVSTLDLSGAERADWEEAVVPSFASALPDPRGRVLVGQQGVSGRNASADSVGQTGGGASLTLSAAQSGVAAHSHSGSFSFSSGGAHDHAPLVSSADKMYNNVSETWYEDMRHPHPISGASGVFTSSYNPSTGGFLSQDNHRHEVKGVVAPNYSVNILKNASKAGTAGRASDICTAASADLCDKYSDSTSNLNGSHRHAVAIPASSFASESSHTHTMVSDSPSHTHNIIGASSAADTAGAASSHNILNPYFAVNYLIKVADTAPAVVSFTRTSAEYTNQDRASYRVQFSEPIAAASGNSIPNGIGFEKSNGAALSGWEVENWTSAGRSVYTFDIVRSSGNVDIKLRPYISRQSPVRDSSGNKLQSDAYGEYVVVDKTAPNDNTKVGDTAYSASAFYNPQSPFAPSASDPTGAGADSDAVSGYTYSVCEFIDVSATPASTYTRNCNALENIASDKISIKITHYDRAGNNKVLTIDPKIDSQNPDLAVQDPGDISVSGAPSWTNENVRVSVRSLDASPAGGDAEASELQKVVVVDVSYAGLPEASGRMLYGGEDEGVPAEGETLCSGGNCENVSMVFKAPADRTITLKAMDNAGNWSQEKSVRIRIDKTLPSVSFPQPGGPWKDLVSLSSTTEDPNLVLQFANGATYTQSPSGSSYGWFMICSGDSEICGQAGSKWYSIRQSSTGSSSPCFYGIPPSESGKIECKLQTNRYRNGKWTLKAAVSDRAGNKNYSSDTPWNKFWNSQYCPLI